MMPKQKLKKHKDADARGDTADMTSAPAAKTPAKTILIVDDEEAMLKVLCHKFERNGFTVHRAMNGKEALDTLAKIKMDAMLLDLFLPGKDGFSVLAEMSATLNKRTPVFMLTNFGQEENIERCKKLGAKDCFIKARTSLNELVDRLRSELGMR